MPLKYNPSCEPQGTQNDQLFFLLQLAKRWNFIYAQFCPIYGIKRLILTNYVTILRPSDEYTIFTIYRTVLKSPWKLNLP